MGFTVTNAAPWAGSLRLATLLGVLAIFQTSGFAQGVIRSPAEVDALAVEYMMALCNAERAYSSKYACLVRGEHWTKQHGNAVTMDTVIARVVDRQKSFDYYVLAYTDFKLAGRRHWEQRYRIDGMSYLRSGDGSSRDWLNH